LIVVPAEKPSLWLLFVGVPLIRSRRSAQINLD
jgi:hypothetical protein